MSSCLYCSRGWKPVELLGRRVHKFSDCWIQCPEEQMMQFASLDSKPQILNWADWAYRFRTFTSSLQSSMRFRP
jgi:hypothetical protein